MTAERSILGLKPKSRSQTSPTSEPSRPSKPEETPATRDGSIRLPGLGGDQQGSTRLPTANQTSTKGSPPEIRSIALSQLRLSPDRPHRRIDDPSIPVLALSIGEIGLLPG